MILPTYTINSDTLAILPAKHIDYESRIIETKTTLNVQTDPLSIIERACINDWTTYEGRRQAVIQHMNFYQKVPIPTNIHQRQIFFPTHSPKHMDNSWIAAHHIMQIQKKHNKTTVQFTNGYHLILNISYYTMRKQTMRSYACLEKITMQQPHTL